MLVLKLLSGKDKTLLIGQDSFLVLDLGLDVINGIRRLHIQVGSISSQGLDKYLHSSVDE